MGMVLMAVFLAVFTIGVISYYGFSGENTYLGYTYETAINTTDAAFSSEANGTHIVYGLDIGRLIDNEADGTYVNITIENTNTSSANITAYLNGDSLGTKIATNETATVLQFEDLQGSLTDGTNTIILASDIDTVAVNNSALYYNDGVKDESIDAMSGLLVGVICVVSIVVYIVQSISRTKF